MGTGRYGARRYQLIALCGALEMEELVPSLLEAARPALNEEGLRKLRATGRIFLIPESTRSGSTVRPTMWNTLKCPSVRWPLRRLRRLSGRGQL